MINVFQFPGNPNKKKPQIMGQQDYGKKNFENLLQWDPRPKEFRGTSVQRRNAFVLDIQKFEQNGDPIPCFAHSVNLKYEDYELKVITDNAGVWDRKSALRSLVTQYIENLQSSLSSLVDDHGLSNEVCIHVSSTLAQSKSDTWKPLRSNRVTASFCLQFSKNPKNCIKNYWYPPPEDYLSNVPAIKYGKDNEKML